MNVNNSNDAAHPDTAPLDLSAVAATEAEPATRRRRRWPIVAGLAAVVVASGGAMAYADARKTVELDVDGEITTVTTMAGSVDGLLEEQGIEVNNRDLVAPATDTALDEGSDVVVRYANQVGVQADGETEDLWTTALDADEALDAYASRGDDVRLVASRSDAEGRADIPLRLDVDGPVNLVDGGETTVVDDGSVGVEQILEDNNIELAEDDRVSVVRDETVDEGVPAVSVLVERVEVKEETETEAIDFETKTVEDPDRYTDEGTAVRSEGAKGERTIVTEVTYLDGEVESTELISDEVTTEPEDRVLVEGTKERPEPEPEPAPAPSPSSSSSSSSSSASQGSAPAGVWSQLAQCESGGNPSTNTGNGYYGLYQFSLPTWQAMGGTGLPSDASAAEQTQRAQALQAQSGWGQWPGCAAKLGLL